MPALAAAAVIVVGAVWVCLTALLAGRELAALRDEATALHGRLTGADMAAATRSAASAAVHARRAHDLTRGPAWSLATRIPLLGDPLRSERGIADAADELARNALLPLTRAGALLTPASVRTADGRIDVEALRRIAPQVEAAHLSIFRATQLTAGSPAHTWLASIDRARAQALTALQTLGRTVDTSARAIRLLPAMLGAERPQTYLLMFQNTAEARGTGGIPGAFALVRADQGRITFERFENDNALFGVTADVRLGEDYTNLYGPPTGTLFVNGNISPHFPYAAEIWASMWRRHSGRQVDGVLAVDPQALSYLLAATGPARLGDGETLSADNIVALTENTAYQRFGPDVAARKSFLLAIARAVAVKVTGPAAEPTGLLRALTRAAQERRLLIWSADANLQAGIEDTAVSGAIPRTNAPYAGMSVVNEGGNKLDYYLDRGMTWQRTGCGARRDVSVTITLKNNAPGNLPDAIAIRADRHNHSVRRGDNRIAIAYAATRGARLSSATLDGTTIGAADGAERGHPVYVVGLELPRGRTRTLVLHLTEPAAQGAPVVLRQPGVQPLTTIVRDQSC